MTNEPHLIPFKAYIPPNAHTRQIQFKCHDKDIYEKAVFLISKGCVFDVEPLQTGYLSMTCMRDEEVMLSIQLCLNEEEDTRKCVETLIKEAHASYTNCQ